MSVLAIRFAAIPDTDAFTSADVLTPCDGFKVRWIYAPAVAAEVVDGQSVMDWTDQCFVGTAMSKTSTPLSVGNEPVAITTTDRTGPWPTGNVAVLCG